MKLRKATKNSKQGLMRLLGSRGIELADRNEESVNAFQIMCVFAFEQKFGQVPRHVFS